MPLSVRTSRLHATLPGHGRQRQESGRGQCHCLPHPLRGPRPRRLRSLLALICPGTKAPQCHLAPRPELRFRWTAVWPADLLWTMSWRAAEQAGWQPPLLSRAARLEQLQRLPVKVSLRASLVKRALGLRRLERQDLQPQVERLDDRAKRRQYPRPYLYLWHDAAPATADDQRVVRHRAPRADTRARPVRCARRPGRQPLRHDGRQPANRESQRW